MKLLIVFALLCAMVALTTSADEGGSDGGKGSTQLGKVKLEKRFFCFWRKHLARIRHVQRHHHHHHHHNHYVPYRQPCPQPKVVRCHCCKHVGWIKYGNRYYHYVPYRWTWDQAQNFCKSKNANLASVRNLGEYRAIQRIIYLATHSYDPTWIGGYNVVQSHWFWSDGNCFKYTYWCHGRPNNNWGKKHCLQMNAGGHKCMHDVPCNYRYPFVCVWKRR